MPQKLLKTKYYIVNLDSRCVATDYNYNRFGDAIDAEKKRHRMKRYTALLTVSTTESFSLKESSVMCMNRQR